MHNCNYQVMAIIMGWLTPLNWSTIAYLRRGPIWSFKPVHIYIDNDANRTTQFGPGHKCCGTGYIFATTIGSTPRVLVCWLFAPVCDVP